MVFGQVASDEEKDHIRELALALMDRKKHGKVDVNSTGEFSSVEGLGFGRIWDKTGYLLNRPVTKADNWEVIFDDRTIQQFPSTQLRLNNSS